MGLKKFLIILDQPVYYSGQMITGRLEVEIDKPMSMKAIYLRYSGKGKVRWEETHQSQGETYTKIYSKSEDYLGLQQLVFGNDEDDSELDEGEHVFLFDCQLPMDLPSSFKGRYGRIRYSVEATIERSWKFNHNTTQPLTVMSVVDLNQNPLAAAPIAERTGKFFFGDSNQFAMSVNVPIRGFVPGQTIPVHVFLDNASGVQIKAVRVIVEQVVTFRTLTNSKTSRKEVVRDKAPVPEGFGCEEVFLNLQLPALPSSYLEFSNIIDLNYQLIVTAKVKPWYHRNLTHSTELIVGNVPLMSYQKPIPVQKLLLDPVDGEDPDCPPPDYGVVFPPGMMYEDLPPPTYAQSMGVDTSGEENPDEDPDDDSQLVEFAPLYPIYKFETKEKRCTED